MPNGGPDHCDNCVSWMAASRTCSLRNISIGQTRGHVFCDNFAWAEPVGSDVPNTARSLTPIGPLQSTGLYACDGYLRIPWHEGNEPQVGTPACCHLCARQVPDGIVVQDGLGFCTNFHYWIWWLSEHFGYGANLAKCRPPEQVFRDVQAMLPRITVVRGNIAKLEVEAIVNAANSSLLGGGGVDGAIHAEAGPELRQECEGLHGAATGEAKMTRGYRLKAKHVIHTVGPEYGGGRFGDAWSLRSAYGNSLRLARQHGIRELAFPSISTGAFAYPVAEATLIATSTVLDFLRTDESQMKIVFCLYDDEIAQAFRDNLQRAR